MKSLNFVLVSLIITWYFWFFGNIICIDNWISKIQYDESSMAKPIFALLDSKGGLVYIMTDYEYEISCDKFDMPDPI